MFLFSCLEKFAAKIRFFMGIGVSLQKIFSDSDARRNIRRAVLPADGERIMEVFSAAKTIMRASGNMHQWGEDYPSLDVVRADIEHVMHRVQ